MGFKAWANLMQLHNRLKSLKIDEMWDLLFQLLFHSFFYCNYLKKYLYVKRKEWKMRKSNITIIIPILKSVWDIFPKRNSRGLIRCDRARRPEHFGLRIVFITICLMVNIRLPWLPSAVTETSWTCRVLQVAVQPRVLQSVLGLRFSRTSFLLWPTHIRLVLCF